MRFSTTNPPMLSQTRSFRLGNRKSRWTLTPATISACSSSRFGDAHVAGHMTGPSVRTPTPGRRLAAVIPGSTITPARRAPISARGVARRVTRASTRMGFSSAGSTPRVTVLSPARTAPVVAGACVSSRTRRSNSGCCHSRVRGVLIHTTGLL